MNDRVLIAQATSVPVPSPVTLGGNKVTVRQPADNVAVVIQVRPNIELDLSDITGRNIVLVQAGDRLIILFQNQASVVLQGFFGPDGKPAFGANVDVGGGVTVSSQQFAGMFPISTDPSILPAAGPASAAGTGSALQTQTTDTSGFNNLDETNPLSLLQPDGGDGSSGGPSTFNAGNSAPVFVGVLTGAAVEAGAGTGGVASVNGAIAALDPDPGQSGFLPGFTQTGLYGVFTFNSGTGAWTYTVNQSKADPLAAGQTGVDQLTVTSLDGTTQVITVTIAGTNDLPVVTSTATAAVGGVTEAGLAPDDVTPVTGPAIATGTLTASDVDAGSSISWSIAGASAYGSMSITPAGVWTYTLDNGLAATQALKEGETKTETFTATVTDDRGAVASQTITLTITGTNDTPVANAAVAAVNEDAVVAGNVSGTDADAGETATLVYALVNPAPTGLTFGADGSYSFDAASYDSLKVGETLVLTIPFTASDVNGTASAPANLVITLTGTNDTPVANAAVAAVNEDAVVAGNVSGTDADAGETATLVYALVNPAPTGLTFGADGSYSFDAASYDALKVGETLVLTIPFTASDVNGTASAPANLVITLTGTNDTPVANAAVAAVNEDAVVAGNVSGTDADAGETATLVYALVNPAPTGLTFGADGSYSFDAASYDSLKVGETLVLTIPFTASDVNGTASAPANLVITLTGTNDTPVANAAVAAVNEDAVVAGNVSGTDADAGETATLVYALVNPAPTGLTFGADGSYSFDAASYDALKVGETLVLTIPFTASDVNGTASAPANLVITLTGTNDTPVANAAVAAVNEDAVVAGNVSGTDADAGETATLVYALTGLPPTGLTFGADGSYSFDAASYDSLKVGETLVLTIPFTASDVNGTASAPANLVITLTGTNDTPVANAAVAAVNEDAVVAGNVSGTDADAGETATLVYALVNPAPTGLTFGADGSYSFDAASYDSLKVGETLVLTIPFTASDVNGTASAPANLVITLTGTNDTPVANAAVAAVNEDAVVAGNVSGTDADAGETATLVYALVNPAPTGLTFGADGSYSFDAASYDALKVGEELVLTIPFTASDVNGTASAPANLVITLTGTNDTPVANAAVAAVNEDAVVAGNVSGTDADAGETATLVYALTGLPPTGLTFGADGSYSFDAASYDALKVGETLVLTIPFTASDVNGTASAPANLVITLTGTNDTPVANAAVAAVNEDAVVAGNVSGTDADAGETATLVYALTGLPPTGLTFGADGSYSFDAASYDSLKVGETLVLTIPFTASDVNGTASAPANLVITLTGTNDTPVANAAVAAVNEDAVVAGNVSGTDADAGETATLVYALTGLPPTGLTFGADGSYSFDAASYDALKVGETLVLTIPFTASDVNGTASAPANLVITLTGTNDTPVANAAVAAVNEDAVVAGNVSGTDADAGETATLVYALTGLPPTGLTFGADGSYSFDAASYDSLKVGETLVLTIPFTASDVNGTASAPANLVITLTGTNDVPVIAVDATGSVHEDVAVSAGKISTNGMLSFSDLDVSDTHTVSTAFQTSTSLLGQLGVLNATVATGASGATAGSLSWVFELTNSAVNFLHTGESIVETYAITVMDNSGATSTKTVTITIEGDSGQPVVTLGDTSIVLTTATAGATPVVVADAASTVTNAVPASPDGNDISTLEARITSGYQTGAYTADGNPANDSGERLELTAAGEALLSGHAGIAAFAGATGLLSLSFATPLTLAEATALLQEIRYVNQIGDFTLNVSPDNSRTVSFRAIETDGVASVWVDREVGVAANVTDTTGLNAFSGSHYADTITGGLGDDTMDGGDGNDLFTYAIGDGADSVTGGAGTGDQLNVTGGASPAFVEINGGATLSLDTNDGSISNIASVEIVNVTLGSDSDTVVLAGDLGVAGVTSFSLTAGAGDDYIDASGVTGSLSLTLNGGIGADTIISTPTGGNTLDGGDDDDSITVRTDDTALGGSGEDTFYALLGEQSTIDGEGGAGDIVVFSLSPAAAVVPAFALLYAVGVDVLADDGSGVVATLANIETVEINGGTQGDTILVAGDFSATGVTAIQINGEDGDDYIDASLLVDGPLLYLTGGNGSDTLIDNDGSNILSGGAGDDSFEALEGDDTISGDAGSDTVFYVLGDGNDVIDGGADDDILSLTIADATDPATYNVTMTGGGPAIDFDLPDGATPTIASIEFIEILLGAGSDTILLQGDFAANGVAGIQIDAGNGDNTVDASLVTSATNLALVAGAGSDAILGGAGDDTIVGGDGDDGLTGGGGADVFAFSGTFGSDSIDDFVSGVDKIDLYGFTAADVSITPGVGEMVVTVNQGGTPYGTITVQGTVTLLDLQFH